MPDKQHLTSIASNPVFTEIVKRRHRMVWGLSLAVLVINVLYILGMSLMPDQFSRPLYSEAYITYGIVYYLLIILVGIAASAYYSWWSKHCYDPMRNELLASLEIEHKGGLDE